MIRFFVITFAVTWTLWGAANDAAEPLRTVLFLLGAWSPGIVALGLTAVTTGRQGVGTLLRRLIAWQVPVRWYVFALSYLAVIKVSVALIYRIGTGSWPPFGDDPWYLMLAATVGSTLIGGQAGEEVGWRGYALPRLAERYGFAGGSVLLGIVWAVWHIPLFLVPAADTFGQSFPLYLLQVTAVSVAMAWLYVNTAGSLLPVMLIHAAINNTKDIVPSAESVPGSPWHLSHSLVAWLTVLLLWIGAGWFLVRLRNYSLVRRERILRSATQA